MATVLDTATLKKIAEISRLKLDEKELRELQKDLSQILSQFSKISEIEARGQELYYVRNVSTVMRKDAPEKRSGEADRIKSQFVKKGDDYMLAPKSL